MHTLIQTNMESVPLPLGRSDQRVISMTPDSVLDIPFNELLQIESCDEPAGLLRLAPRPCLANHVGTLHAGALMTLAEAASAKFLMLRLGMRQDVIPLLRRF